MTGGVRGVLGEKAEILDRHRRISRENFKLDGLSLSFTSLATYIAHRRDSSS